MEQLALKYYNENLKMIHRIIGKKATTNRELDKIGKFLFGDKYIAAFPYDRKPRLKNNQYCIVNTDSSKRKGMHWCAICRVNNTNYFYDSFGRYQSRLIPKLRGKYINSDLDVEQKKIESDCGQRCMAWLCVVHLLGIDYAVLI